MTTIRAIAHALPERALTNAALAEEHPSWDMERVVERAGVRSRRIAAPGETALDLSLRACEELVREPGLDLGSVKALVCCTQTPDHPIPGNAHLLHARLGLADDVLAFDYNLACSGYLYGLAFADSFASSGLSSETLLVTADTYSRLIHPGDRSSRVLFGDGAAATHLTAADGGWRDRSMPGGRIVAAELCSRGRDLERFYVPAGGARMPRDGAAPAPSVDRHGNVRSDDRIQMDGFGIWSFVNSTVPGHVERFLAERSLAVGDVDLFVFHQASALILDSLAAALGVEDGKMFTHMADTGNLVSASIPVALQAALDQGAIGSGDRVLLSGYGAGMSYGSVLVEF